MPGLFDHTNAPHRVPKAIVKGDYVAWRISDYVATYPPADHTLTYVFRREGEPAREFKALSTADSGEYLFEISVSETNDLEVGIYHYDLYLVEDSSSKRITVDQGRLEVLTNRDDSADDPRTFPRKMIVEIERALLGRANNNQLDTLAYSMGVESSATRDPRRLIEMRDKMRSELVAANRKVRARLGKPHSGKIKARF